MEIKQEVEAQIATVKAWPWKRWIVYVLIAVGALAGLTFAYKLFWPKPAIVSTPAVLPEAPKVVKVEKVYIPGPVRWRVYKKTELAGKIPLSPGVANDPKVQVAAVAVIPPSPHGGTAVSFTNVSTGITGIDYTPRARPWFGFGGQTEVGLRGGIGTSGTVGVVYARQDVLRVGKINLAGYGEAGIRGNKADAAALLDVSVRW